MKWTGRSPVERAAAAALPEILGLWQRLRDREARSPGGYEGALPDFAVESAACSRFIGVLSG
jgi:hypothetical protein